MSLTQVYAAKVDGNDYDTVPPNRPSSGAGGNGGSATRIGSSSTKLDNVNVTRTVDDVFGSTVIDGDDTNKSLSSGTFAYNNQSPIAKKVTTSLAGVANDVLRSGASTPRLVRSIHRQEKVRTTRYTTAVRAGYWNIYSGQWSTTPTTAVDAFWDNANDTTSATSTDQAASPSRSIPGELVYKTGKLEPVQDDYKSKTG
jgi:hypothetical protein